MIDTGFVQLSAPTGWESFERNGETMIAAPVQRGAFRPNLGISTAPFAGSVAAATTQAVAGALALLERVHVINYEIWPFPDTDGRRIEYSHEMAGATLHVQHWLMVKNGFLTRFTATCRTAQLPGYDPVFTDMLWSVRNTSPDTAGETGGTSERSDA